MTMIDAQLRVDDEEFLVASMIERCPKTMMLRELAMNAIEAASNVEEGRGKIWIGSTLVDGVSKLTIRNNGRGMDSAALRRMSDIAASIGKIKGLSENFGMGAKVASLPSNPLGVRYRSCADGRVFECVIGKFDGVYSRLVRTAPDGTLADVIEVSDLYDSETLAADWTEVLLFGQSPDQDTVLDPHAGSPSVKPFWIPQSLYHRFFQVPDTVDIEIEEGLHWSKGTQAFETIASRRGRMFERTESVVTPEGLVIHYHYDPAHPQRRWENLSSEGSLQTSASIAGIVFRNEIYDLRVGSPWIHEAPRYGIAFAARHVSVLVELPDNFAATPDAYRQFLRYADADQSHVELEHFVRNVREFRPDWLLEIFDEIARQAEPSGELLSQLKDFRREIGVLLYEHVEHPEMSPEELKQWIEPELEIVHLEDELDINDRWLNGRAACYYPETRQLFINARYESVDLLANELKSQAERDGLARYGVEEIEKLARIVALEAIVRRLARSLFYGLGKASDPERWQKGHIEKAISPEAFSMIADEWRDLIPLSLKALKRRVGVDEDPDVLSRRTVGVARVQPVPAPLPAEPAPVAAPVPAPLRAEPAPVAEVAAAAAPEPVAPPVEASAPVIGGAQPEKPEGASRFRVRKLST